jgi:hypothetical protein
VSVEGIDPARMTWASRLFRAEYLMYLVVFAFAIVYAYLLRVAWRA